MSVVVARDESILGQIVFAWPDPVPWGAELVCGEDEAALVCPNWEVAEALGPGKHVISPPNPNGRIHVYFVGTKSHSVSFEQSVTAFDRATGQTIPVRFSGRAEVKIGDPKLLCHQIAGLPYRDFHTGILRSAASSITKTFRNVITKVCLASPSVSALASTEAAAQLVNMAAGASPMIIAVAGLDLVRFEEFHLSVHDGATVSWKPGTGSDPATAAPAQPAAAAGARGGSGEILLPFAAGSSVLVYWNDGLWHAATVHQVGDGGYQVALDGVDSLAWVRANQVRSAS